MFRLLVCWSVSSSQFPRSHPSCDSWRWERQHRERVCVCSHSAFWEGYASSGRTEDRFSPFIKLTFLSLHSSSAHCRSWEGVCLPVGTSKTVWVLIQEVKWSRQTDRPSVDVCRPLTAESLRLPEVSDPLLSLMFTPETPSERYCSFHLCLSDTVRKIQNCFTVSKFLRIFLLQRCQFVLSMSLR